MTAWLNYHDRPRQGMISTGKTQLNERFENIFGSREFTLGIKSICLRQALDLQNKGNANGSVML
jgi:hypothetical protein